VTIRVKLRKFAIAPQSTVVAPYHSAMISVTPNTAIPAAGEASLTLTSNQAVDATLATGTASGLTLSPLGTPVARAVLSDVTGGGFGEATLTNASAATTTVSWTLLHHGKVTSTGSTSVGAGDTISLGVLLGGRSKLRGSTLVVASATPAMVVNAILSTSPVGVTLASALNGG
jgi:hypothetical protein